MTKIYLLRALSNGLRRSAPAFLARRLPAALPSRLSAGQPVAGLHWAAIGTMMAVLGCGRPATKQDCERIVARVAELELQQASISDPQAVESQIRNAQSAFRQRMNTDCIGRRLRPSSLECVENATTAGQIVSECF